MGVTIRTARENEWIRRNLLNNVPGIPAAEAWIGLNDQVVEGAFAWDSGAPATFFTWAPGEPNNLGNEDFAALFTKLVDAAPAPIGLGRPPSR